MQWDKQQPLMHPVIRATASVTEYQKTKKPVAQRCLDKSPPNLCDNRPGIYFFNKNGCLREADFSFRNKSDFEADSGSTIWQLRCKNNYCTQLLSLQQNH